MYLLNCSFRFSLFSYICSISLRILLVNHTQDTLDVLETKTSILFVYFTMDLKGTFFPKALSFDTCISFSATQRWAQNGAHTALGMILSSLSTLHQHRPLLFPPKQITGPFPCRARTADPFPEIYTNQTLLSLPPS